MITIPWLDKVTGSLKYLAIYLIFICALTGAGISKLAHPTPPGIVKEFAGSWVATFPGTAVSWKIAGAGELIVVLLMLVSLVTLEWMGGKSKKVLRLALVAAMLVFAVLAVGQDVGGSDSGAAELFMYFGATAVVWLVVRKDEQDEVVG